MENKTCNKCQKQFVVDDYDLEFYKKIDVSSPTKCPECRFKRRLLERNARTLYYRKCDATGKQIISQYDDTVPFPVYEQTEWFSDKWDGLEYGQEIEFNRPFFEQFAELKNKVP